MTRQSFTIFVAFTILTLTLAQNATTYTYKTIDNLNLTLDVYIPSQSPYAKYPVIFQIHGGGYVELSKNYGLSQLETTEVLSLGFVYITIDYRLVPGVLLPDVVQDCQDAYNFVRNDLADEININVDAIIVMGRSAGGGLALIGGYTFEPQPLALIAFYPGYTNFTIPSLYDPSTPVPAIIAEVSKVLSKPVLAEYISSGGVDPYGGLFWETVRVNKLGWFLTSRDPKEPSDQILGTLKKFSAVYHVNKDYPPTYLLHGLNDTMVPCDQSIMMATALNETNATYIFELVPGANHGFDEFLTDPKDPIFQQYVMPAFDFAVNMVQKELGIEYNILSM